MIEPQLQPCFKLLTLSLGAENRAKNCEQNGTGNTYKRGVKSNAHAGQSRHKTAANAVKHTEPLGSVGIADKLGKGVYGKAQTKESTEKAKGNKKRNCVIKKTLALKQS